MKKLSLIIALSLALPLTAMADDDDVTIRVMEMNEVSADTVMQEIQLPESASEQAEENGLQGNRARERVREMHENGDELMEHAGEMEQEREMEQQHEGMMDDIHDQQNLETDVDMQQDPDMGGMHGSGGPN